MKEAQLDALLELMGNRTQPKMRAAMRDVLCNDMQQKAAAIKHGVSPGSLWDSVDSARKKLKLAYKAITGQEYTYDQ